MPLDRTQLLVSTFDLEHTALKLARQWKCGVEFTTLSNGGWLGEHGVDGMIAHSRAGLGDELTLSAVHCRWDSLGDMASDPANTARARADVRTALSMAEQLGSRVVVVHTGYETWRVSDERRAEWLEHNIAFWQDIVSEPFGPMLALENTFETPEDLTAVFEAVRHPQFGWCLDTGHVLCYAHSTHAYYLELLADRLIHLHIHDNDGNQDSHQGAGNGIVPWDWLLPALDELPARPTISYETYPDGLAPTYEVFQRILGSRWA